LRIADAFAALAVLAVAAVLVGLNVHGLRDRLFLSMFARSRIRGCLRSAGLLLTGSQVNTAGVQWTFAGTGRQEHGWSSTFWTSSNGYHGEWTRERWELYLRGNNYRRVAALTSSMVASNLCAHGRQQ